MSLVPIETTLDPEPARLALALVSLRARQDFAGAETVATQVLEDPRHARVALGALADFLFFALALDAIPDPRARVAWVDDVVAQLAHHENPVQEDRP